MDIVSLVNLLDHPHQASYWLNGWGLRDVEAGRATLGKLAEHGLTLDLLADFCGQLGQELPQSEDPDAVLQAVGDFMTAARSPLALAALFERDRQALPTLLRVLNLGPQWRKTIVQDPEAFDLLRMTDGQPVSGDWLKAEVCGELANFSDERLIVAGLQRIQRRELLRIVYGDLIRHQRFELVTEQLTFLADALIEAAVRAARRKLQDQRPDPKRASGSPGRFAVIALGRLGGLEMDYSGALELLLIHEPLPGDDHARRTAQDFFERLSRLILRFLTETGDDGESAYRVELPIRREEQTSLALPADDAANYLDDLGRTWHREAFIKARTVAGDLDLGQNFLRQLQPWIYRRYLSRADETGIRALKRRLERRSAARITDSFHPTDVADTAKQVEEVVQFLQLLNGGDLPIVRATGALPAIAGLEQAGVLTVPERTALEDEYRSLRELEHRLQTLARPPVDPPAAAVENAVADAAETVARLARFNGKEQASATEALARWQQTIARCRETTTRVLAAAFAGDPQTPPEVDLLLAAQPTADEIATVLGRYNFRDTNAAYRYLQALSNEHVPYLSTRRCRYFLSTIAPQLLSAVAATPDPDHTLANLSQVSDSIGGKGVLWELFRSHPPSLELYVRLCAASPYLSGILTSNPGMIDELVNSLQLLRIPSQPEMMGTFTELCRGASDTLPVLHGFKNSQHLQIGVRELLGKESVDTTHRALADVAETCLTHVTQSTVDKLIEKHGMPTIGPGPFEGQACRFAIIATGKLGGREPNYHSHLELVFLYESDGLTQPTARGRRHQQTANGHFFSQLAQRVVKDLSQLSPWGRLYTVEVPLRPASGSLVMSLADLEQHFQSDAATLDQWRALCKARSVFGPPEFQAQALGVVHELLTAYQPQPDDAEQLLTARQAAQTTASPWNLKRAAGGSLDVEFLVQALQLRFASQTRGVLQPGTLEAIAALQTAGHLTADDAHRLAEGYQWLRQVESSLRLLNTEPRHDLPDDEIALRKLALLLRDADPLSLQDRCQTVMQNNRALFERLLMNVTTQPV